MNGLELQVALGRRGYAIPIIMITGVADAETELEALRLGAIAFLRKPFNAGTLLDAVATALDPVARGLTSAREPSRAVTAHNP